MTNIFPRAKSSKLSSQSIHSSESAGQDRNYLAIEIEYCRNSLAAIVNNDDKNYNIGRTIIALLLLPLYYRQALYL